MLPSSLELNFNCSGDVLINRIRNLAKRTYWQTVFSYAKEIRFKLFDNETNFSDIQILLLNYLGFYSVLNMDIAIGDVSDIVLQDEIYEEAYMWFKQKSDRKKISERPKTTSQVKKEEPSPQVNWVFKKPKKA